MKKLSLIFILLWLATSAGGVDLKAVVPGGSGQPQSADGQIKLIDFQGEAPAGKATEGSTTLIIGGAALLGAAGPAPEVEGWVPLAIKRQGKDLEISWNNDLYPAPRLFALDSATAGDYQNNYDDSKWSLVAANGALVAGVTGYSYSPGKLVHQNQVGTGTAAMYYKGIQAGASPAAYFSQAGAVGKINVTVGLDWNMVSPTVFANSLNKTLGTDFIAGDELYNWDNSSQQALSKVAVFDGTAWQLVNSASWNNLANGVGYGLNILNLPSGQTTRTITLVGNVRPDNFAAVINKDWNKIGAPFPHYTTLNGNSGFTAGVSQSGDEFWMWDLASKGLTRVSKFNGSVWTPEFVLRPGVGYGYNYMGKETEPLPWQINKQ
ncbi:MAG: hypothetical protein WC529_07490 [Candidatus Margulisiibacteriota bacterium]